jgi:predicted metal-dependent hydrolase
VEIMYPNAYIDYLIHFHTDRDYFECHEILEEHWKQDGQKRVWVILIQIAVAFYHHRRGNEQGARKMMQKALSLLQGENVAIEQLGLDHTQLIKQLQHYIEQLDKGQSYRSIQLPIMDEELLKTCQRICRERGLVWGKESDIHNEFLLHKHKLRDRSDVIAAREQKKKNKGLPKT